MSYWIFKISKYDTIFNKIIFYSIEKNILHNLMKNIPINHIVWKMKKKIFTFFVSNRDIQVVHCINWLCHLWIPKFYMLTPCKPSFFSHLNIDLFPAVQIFRPWTVYQLWNHWKMKNKRKYVAVFKNIFIHFWNRMDW